jgi:hypothetical protein
MAHNENLSHRLGHLNAMKNFVSKHPRLFTSFGRGGNTFSQTSQVTKSRIAEDGGIFNPLTAFSSIEFACFTAGFQRKQHAHYQNIPNPDKRNHVCHEGKNKFNNLAV